MSATATIRDLRTRFPKIKAMVEREGEVIVTDHGRPSFVLRPYRPQPPQRPPPVDYYARLMKRAGKKMSRAAARALDDANREER